MHLIVRPTWMILNVPGESGYVWRKAGQAPFAGQAGASTRRTLRTRQCLAG